MSNVKYMRKNHVISDIDGKTVFTGFFKAKVNGKVVDVPSINAAKRESRRLQEQYGPGCLRVVK